MNLRDSPDLASPAPGLKVLLTGSGEMTQRVRAFVVKPEDLSLIPGTHMPEGGNQL